GLQRMVRVAARRAVRDHRSRLCARGRRWLTSLALSGGLCAVSAASSQSLALELVATGLAQPVHLTAPAGDTRLFVCENRGLVKVLVNGAALASPFLDLSAQVHPIEGLASLAFHPAYPAT